MNEIQKFNDISGQIPVVFEKNKLSLAKAREVKNTLVLKVQNGMTSEIDIECNDFLLKAKKQLEIMEERRKPITQMLSMVSKEYTTLEADFKKDIEQIQEFRNKFAKEELERQREKEAQAQILREIELEKIEVEKTLEIQLKSHFEKHLESEIKRLYDHFNEITQENHAAKRNVIEKANVVYRRDLFDSFVANIPTKRLNNDHKKAIKARVMEGKYELFAASYTQEMQDVINSLLDRFASKLAELESIRLAEMTNKQEAERLRKEAETRELEEKKRLGEEAIQRKIQAEKEAEMKAEEGKMMTLFTQVDEPKRERTGFEIKILHPSAYMQIFALWFELEGKDLPMDTLEKRTIKQMKSFCESYAHKNDQFIESKYIKYEETVKVRAK